MKFSQAERETIETANYHPGPGFYHNIYRDQLNMQLNKGLNDQQNQSNWAQSNRFQIEENKKKKDQQEPAPGQYSISEKLGKSYTPSKKSRRVKGPEGSIKANSIPSIPAAGSGPGYQELGEGLLILMREPLSNQDNQVAPNTYSVSMSQVKKSSQGFIIKKEENQSLLKKLQQEQSQQNQQIQYLKLQPMADNEKIQDKYRKNNNKKDIIKTLQKSQTTSHMEQSQWLTKEQNNLELHLLRGKMLDKYASEIPPPGYYYDKNKQSSFKIGNKAIEWQCFDSSSGRFEIKKIDERPGVGEYNMAKYKNIEQTKSLPFNLAKKQPIFNTKNASQIPASNNYKIEVPFTKTTQHKQSNNFPTPFNSGTTRFQDSNGFKKFDSSVGPGQYNMDGFAEKYKQAKKQLSQQIVYVKPQNNNNEKQKNQKKIDMKMVLAHENYSEDMENANDSTDIQSMSQMQYHQQENQKKQKQFKQQQESSAFKSNIKRFQNEHRSMTQDNIGPGSYKSKSSLYLNSYNIQPNPNMNKTIRKLDMGQKQRMCPKKVGPQSYNGNMDSVKSSKTYQISI